MAIGRFSGKADCAIRIMEASAAQEASSQVVIVGGGFGGLSAAKELAGKGVRVTLIDRTNHHLFQPLLYQVATAGLSPADIAQAIRHILQAPISKS